MPEPNKYDRRHFLRSAAMTLLATKFGLAQRSTVQSAGMALPAEGALPSLGGAVAWLNSQPLGAQDLRGKVVLVEFWTFTCINWLRQLPYVRRWAAKYREHGLIVIGVHTPEFSFEKNVDNVRRAAKEMRVEYPIAIDSDYAVWRAFNNQYWPALYFADAQGRIRHHVFGEGEYEQSERVLQQLLIESGGRDLGNDLAVVDAQGAEAPADWSNLGSAENYVGYQRTERFASAGGPVLERPHLYSVPARLSLNQWALAGEWTTRQEAIVLNQPGGRIAYCFHARDLNLVMGPGPGSKHVRFRAFIDGQPAGMAHGSDLDIQGNGLVTEPRMYQLIRQQSPIVDRLFEIEFLDSGAEAFSFTFG
jgi:thiol-disulfide isomerase/thioredoxin